MPPRVLQLLHDVAEFDSIQSATPSAAAQARRYFRVMGYPSLRTPVWNSYAGRGSVGREIQSLGFFGSTCVPNPGLQVRHRRGGLRWTEARSYSRASGATVPHRRKTPEGHAVAQLNAAGPKQNATPGAAPDAQSHSAGCARIPLARRDGCPVTVCRVKLTSACSERISWSRHSCSIELALVRLADCVQLAGRIGALPLTRHYFSSLGTNLPPLSRIPSNSFERASQSGSFCGVRLLCSDSTIGSGSFATGI